MIRAWLEKAGILEPKRVLPEVWSEWRPAQDVSDPAFAAAWCRVEGVKTGVAHKYLPPFAFGFTKAEIEVALLRVERALRKRLKAR